MLAIIQIVVPVPDNPIFWILLVLISGLLSFKVIVSIWDRVKP